MRKFSLRGGGDYIRLGIEELARMKISMLAANTGYFIVLSVFPALLLLLSGLRYTGLSVDDLLEALNGVIPQAMMSTARGLILSVYNNASGTVAGVSALTALWSSSRGMYGLLTGMNTIYGVAEDRGYLYTRSISVLYTFLFVIVLLLTLLLHVFGGTLMKFARQLNLPGMTVLLDILDMRFLFLLVLQSLLFTAMFMFLPNRRNRFWESLPGGLLAQLGQLVPAVHAETLIVCAHRVDDQRWGEFHASA